MQPRLLIQQLLGELKQTLDQLGPMVKRDAQFPNAPNKIKVAVGMRRVGKTYFLYQTIKDLLERGVEFSNILYINFEDDRLLAINNENIMTTLIDAFYTLHPENHDKKCYLFFDEVQNVPNWATVIRRFYDTKIVEIYLTGSSAKLLSKEIATSLRGRSLATEIWPYSFDEYQRAHDISIKSRYFDKKAHDMLFEIFQHYFSEGGFPEVQQYTSETRQRTLQDYVDVVIYRDIVERYQISQPLLIKNTIMAMINNIAKPFSINKFYNDFKSQGYKVTKDALYHFSDYIEDAYICFSVPMHSKSIRKVQTNPKKAYAIDAGLIRAITLNYESDYGRLFENLIYLDFRRRGYIVQYYLTADRQEVDFIVQDRQGNKKLYQVVWDMIDTATRDREMRALETAKMEIKTPGEVITLDSYLSGAFKANLFE